MTEHVVWPTIRKESPFAIFATHDLKGVTTHPDAMAGVHGHRWTIHLIWTAPYNCQMGFMRDEKAIEDKWGARLEELRDKNLSELMGLPATAENFACWLLFCWLPRLSQNEVNFELDGIRVTKDGHSVEVRRTETNKRGWEWFGGETA
jgi:hypothetical protein